MVRLCLTLLAALSQLNALAKPITLQLPLACELGRTCFVQHYVDHDRLGRSARLHMRLAHLRQT